MKLAMICGAVVAAVCTLAVAVWAVSEGDWRWLPVHVGLLGMQAVIIGVNLVILGLGGR